MQNNLEAVLQVMKFIYDNIIYAELNTKSDYCQVCGWDGEIEIVEDGGKLIWRCPKCCICKDRRIKVQSKSADPFRVCAFCALVHFSSSA